MYVWKRPITTHRWARLIAGITLCFVILSVAGMAWAETRYVDPTGEAVVRRGQGNKYKILAVVKEGTPVELIREDEGYALVRLENGQQGWIVKRYLEKVPPPTQHVAMLQKEKEQWLQEKEEMATRLDELTAALTSAKATSNTLTSERDKVVDDYHKLQRDTADVMKIRQEMEETAAENEQLAKQIAVLEAENGKMKKDRAINWFLAGGGVLLCGILLGKMPGPSRRRKSSLLS